MVPVNLPVPIPDEGLDLGGLTAHDMIRARRWIEAAMKDAGGEITGGSYGEGGCDVDVEIHGRVFNISMRAR